MFTIKDFNNLHHFIEDSDGWKNIVVFMFRLYVLKWNLKPYVRSAFILRKNVVTFTLRFHIYCGDSHNTHLNQSEQSQKSPQKEIKIILKTRRILNTT